MTASTRMFAALQLAAQSHQVLVLTCRERAFAGLGGNRIAIAHLAKKPRRCKTVAPRTKTPGSRASPGRFVKLSTAGQLAARCRCSAGMSGLGMPAGRIVRAARLALEEGALLDGQRLMEDVALDVAGGLQHHALAAHRAHDVAAHDDLLGDDAAGDARLLADDDVGAVDVALHLAVDLHFALGDEVAVDREIGADDGRRVALAAARDAERRGPRLRSRGRSWRAGSG